MTVAALAVSDSAPLAVNADILVVGVRSSDAGPRIVSDEPALVALEASLTTIGMTGGVDELRRLPLVGAGATSLALVGLGAGDISDNDLRYAAGAAARQLVGVDSIAFALPAATDAAILAILEGAAIGAYSYTAHRSTTLASTKVPASTITVLGSTDSSLPQRAAAVAQAVHSVRDLVNAPPSHLYPETLADAIVELAADAPVTVEVLTESELEEHGFGGILAVGKGSSRGPRLVKVSYEPQGATKHIALVGKGITFDSGGLSLKPAASMIGMKYDMTGAATVGAVVIAAAQLGLPVRLTAWLCIAENLPSGTAARPNDVITIHGGKTVEYLNTDAEGRIVLADGLVAASNEQPDAIVDVATLTGAARIALGNRYIGVMGNDELADRFAELASSVGEPAWRMPLPAELRPMLNSDIADIQNFKPGNTAAGMMLAAVFLKDFVGFTGDGDNRRQIPWVHLDIAGPANNEGGGYGYIPKGSTGVTVRALLTLAEEF